MSNISMPLLLVIIVISICLTLGQIYAIISIFQVSMRYIVDNKDRVLAILLTTICIILFILSASIAQLNLTYYLNYFGNVLSIMGGILLCILIPRIWLKYIKKTWSVLVFIIVGLISTMFYLVYNSLSRYIAVEIVLTISVLTQVILIFSVYQIKKVASKKASDTTQGFPIISFVLLNVFIFIAVEIVIFTPMVFTTSLEYEFYLLFSGRVLALFLFCSSFAYMFTIKKLPLMLTLLVLYLISLTFSELLPSFAWYYLLESAILTLFAFLTIGYRIGILFIVFTVIWSVTLIVVESHSTLGLLYRELSQGIIFLMQALSILAWFLHNQRTANLSSIK